MERTATACCLCSSSVRGWLGPNFALHRIMPCPVEAIDTQPVWGHLEPRISKVFCPAMILSNHSGRIFRIRLVSPKATAASTKSSFALPSPQAGSSDRWRRHQAEATRRKLRVVFTWLPSPLSDKPNNSTTRGGSGGNLPAAPREKHLHPYPPMQHTLPQKSLRPNEVELLLVQR